MNSSLSSPALETALRCRLSAYAAMQSSVVTIAQLRRQPLVIAGETLSASFLRHAEDQTVLALRAMALALEQSTWRPASFADWGVVAAPYFLGRASMAQALERFRQEGAWGISPHLIPHQSLHAISGTISQALKIYGPNFGVGGESHACPDAFLLATALLADGSLPGLWLVLTGHDAEMIPGSEAGRASSPLCQAIVMALTPGLERSSGLHLSLGQASSLAAQDNACLLLPEFQLGNLMQEWAKGEVAPNGKWRLSDTHWIEFETVLDQEVLP